MVVNRLGYLSKAKVLKMLEDKEVFSIYKTKKNTEILVKDTDRGELYLFYPLYDRLPYVTVEGKKITSGKQIFCSKTDSIELLDFSGWNNQSQIMAYTEFYVTY